MTPKIGFNVEIGTEDLVTPGGLEFIGAILRSTKLRADVDSILGANGQKGIKASDCVAAYIGLLCQGKTAFEDMREMTENP